MDILFVHQNAPGQFRHLAQDLARNDRHRVVFLGQRVSQSPGNVRWLRYPAQRSPRPTTHHYVHRFESSVRRGQGVVRACMALRDEGFRPDLIVAHPGWGETLFLRDLMPRSVILSYCEMFYRAEGQDGNYIPETTLDLDGICRLRAWNADLLTALDTMDAGIAPTAWQRAQHPAVYHRHITVGHDGVDLNEVAPDPNAVFSLPDGRRLTQADEVVTFVARNLEPVRGFLSLMRALPTLLRLRPRAHIVICGDDGVSYGKPPGNGGTWRQAALREVQINPLRVSFVGRLARPQYLTLLQVSSLHLYLSVPFVLSWSCAEALAAGCIVLGSDVAPVREVLQDGVNGFLVDSRDPDAVGLRAADLLAQASGLGAVRERARQTAFEQFDLRRCLAAQHRLIAGLTQ